MPPNQKQTNLSQWSLLDAFTVEDAACLWVGIDPSTPAADRSTLEISKFTPIFKLLSMAIKDDILPVNLSRNLFSERGKYSSSRVTRDDLKVFAKIKGAQPPFLFDPAMLKVETNESPDTGNDLSVKSKAGRPSRCEKEVWLERLIILYLNNKFDIGNSQDAVAAALSEDLQKQGIKVKASSIKRDWIGPILKKAKAESKSGEIRSK